MPYEHNSRADIICALLYKAMNMSASFKSEVRTGFTRQCVCNFLSNCGGGFPPPTLMVKPSSHLLPCTKTDNSIIALNYGVLLCLVERTGCGL